MEVNIWSDVRCPFCYIGKRKFEKALEDFEYKDQIKVIWRSFELDPNLKTEPDIDALDRLATIKGMSRDQANQMTDQVVQSAKGTGITLDFEHLVVANSFHAHRLIQFAKSKDLGTEAEEALFKAYFSEGKNIDDKEVLRKIGIGIGLEEKELEETLSTDAYGENVRSDEEKAQSLAIRGVPFFVFNNKHAVSGAQPEEVFSQILHQSWNEFESNHPLTVNKGNTCSTDGDC